MQKNIRTPATIGAAEERCLLALARYGYLTARQCTTLLFSPGSLTHVQATLKGLVEGEYAQRLFLPRPTPHGRAPAVYTLARRGRSYLAAAGVDVPVRLRPAEEAGRSSLHLGHTLAVGDLLIALEVLCRRVPRVTIARMLHERALKRLPIPVAGPGSRGGVIPDGWADVRVAMPDGIDRQCIGFELDQGTHEQKAYRRKAAAWIDAAAGPYQEVFGTDLLTVAVVATPGAGRVRELMRWTAAELAARGEEAQAGLFRFTGLPVAQTDPVAFFCSPSWHGLDIPRPAPLIEGVGETADTDGTIDNCLYE